MAQTNTINRQRAFALSFYYTVFEVSVFTTSTFFSGWNKERRSSSVALPLVAVKSTNKFTYRVENNDLYI